MSSWTEDTVATELLACESDRRDRDKFTDEWPELDVDTGYRIQDETLRRRLARGETLVGVKLGLTSKAKQERMGVDQPLVAWLTDAMVLQPGDPVPQDALIHPRIEPEIVFVMRERLEGPGVTAEQALAAVGEVLAGAEVIDSRYRDFKFDLKSVVADNTSASRFVVGGRAVDARSVDLRTTGIVLEKNGQAVALGAGAAVLGHPAAAVAMLVNHLGRRGQSLPAGSLVLSGGATEAVSVQPGDHVSLRVQGMGSVSLRFV